MVYKRGVQSVEVVFDTGSLHHQILGTPRQELLSHVVLQLYSLGGTQGDRNNVNTKLPSWLGIRQGV